RDMPPPTRLPPLAQDERALQPGENSPPNPGPPAAAAYLASVAVEETPEGISVSVGSTDGHRAVRTLQSGVAGMDEAVVTAVVELTGHAQVVLADVGEHQLGGKTVITVLLDVGEDHYISGAAIQSGGRAYAVARAAWTAVTSQV
ncbi:MAG: hypothetical protein U9N84_07985, partial [Actinomycetota bacterium]|nr:hypothetical protein [Actinomycetota bacterium]